MEVDVNPQGRIRVERVRDFGDIWLALELIKRLGLYDFFPQVLPPGREKISWAKLAYVLIIPMYRDSAIRKANFMLPNIIMDTQPWQI